MSFVISTFSMKVDTEYKLEVVAVPSSAIFFLLHNGTLEAISLL